MIIGDENSIKVLALVVLGLFFQLLKFILGQKFLNFCLSCISCTKPSHMLHPNLSYVEGRISSLKPSLNKIFTCLFPAIPLNCQLSSEHWAKPVAPNGCPLLVRPPEGLTTTFPP